jgi:hypothetical protein
MRKTGAIMALPSDNLYRRNRLPGTGLILALIGGIVLNASATACLPLAGSLAAL